MTLKRGKGNWLPESTGGWRAGGSRAIPTLEVSSALTVCEGKDHHPPGLVHLLSPKRRLLPLSGTG